jgi:ArsR family transcriptional regulator
MTQVSARHDARPDTPAAAAACCGPIDTLLKPDLFKALCDPTRAGLVACIAKCGRPCSVSEVAACCSVDTSVVSRHLSTLEKAGVLVSEREGRVVRYSVRYAGLSGTLRALADAIDACCPEEDSGLGEPGHREGDAGGS